MFSNHKDINTYFEWGGFVLKLRNEESFIKITNKFKRWQNWAFLYEECDTKHILEENEEKVSLIIDFDAEWYATYLVKWFSL